uniref:Uncharacterized protein n=1 Tax=uncultured bacterium A1Q1_fos_1025 TaxID=1256537 RepID=L7VX24_9BACT|nr:hypothetical protein [uncultured bacterium A1Q1_fos_1025]
MRDGWFVRCAVPLHRVLTRWSRVRARPVAERVVGCHV